MTQRSVGILAVGVHLPADVRRNDWWPEEIVRAWREKTAESLLTPRAERDDLTPGMKLQFQAMNALRDDPFRGARERRVKPKDVPFSDLETLAAEDAIARAGIAREDVGLLLVYSQVPDYLTVGNSCLIHKKLGLGQRCLSMETEAACNTFMTQYSLAEQYVASGRAKYALLIQSCGMLHLARTEDPHSAWFGDAATAVVLGAVKDGRGMLGAAHRTDGDVHDALVTSGPVGTGTRWFESTPTFQVMNSRAAKQMLVTTTDHGKQIVDEALADANVRAEDINFYASHQATPWFRAVSQEYCGLTRARSFDSFAWTGNVSACNLPLQLALGSREGLLREDDLVAMYSGGSGMIWSGMVMRWGS